MSEHPRAGEGVDDAVLVQRVALGDTGALAEIYVRYGTVAFSLARRIVADTGFAEDVVQEVFLSLWRDPPASTLTAAASRPGCSR